MFISSGSLVYGKLNALLQFSPEYTVTNCCKNYSNILQQQTVFLIIKHIAVNCNAFWGHVTFDANVQHIAVNFKSTGSSTVDIREREEE